MRDLSIIVAFSRDHSIIVVPSIKRETFGKKGKLLERETFGNFCLTLPHYQR